MITMTPLPINQQPSPQDLAMMPIPIEDVERRQRMQDAWKAYRGELQKPLKIKAGQTDDNVRSNRCAPIVDKGVSYLFGPVLKIEATDETTSDAVDSPIQDFLNGLWGDDDDRMTLLGEAETNGGVCGSAFIKIVPAQHGMKYPRLVVLDPYLVRLVTAPDDCSLVQAIIIEYPTGNNNQLRQVIARVDNSNTDEILGNDDMYDTWNITSFVREGSSWYQSGDVEEWPYPFPPVFFCKNLPNPNESWGKPDLTSDIIELNKALNFISSNIARILKYHAHPKTWAKGVGPNEMSIGVDDVVLLQSPNAQIGILEMTSNLASSLNFASEVRADMDEQSRVPAVALGRMVDLPKGNISGVTLQLLFQPLLEKTTQKRRLYGKLIRDVSRAALILCGMISVDQYDDYKIDLHWTDLLPMDDLAAAQTALLWKQMGVSSATLLQTAGFDPDDEAAKNQSEAMQQLTNYSRGQGMPVTSPMQNPQADAALQKSVGEA